VWRGGRQPRAKEGGTQKKKCLPIFFCGPPPPPPPPRAKGGGGGGGIGFAWVGEFKYLRIFTMVFGKNIRDNAWYDQFNRL